MGSERVQRFPFRVGGEGRRCTGGDEEKEREERMESHERESRNWEEMR